MRQDDSSSRDKTRVGEEKSESLVLSDLEERRATRAEDQQRDLEKQERARTYEKSLIIRSSTSVDVLSIAEPRERAVLEGRESNQKKEARGGQLGSPASSVFLLSSCTHRPSIVGLHRSRSNIVVR